MLKVNNTKVFVLVANFKSLKINIHHIIPKSISFEEQKVIDNEYGNSIANLIPILKEENKKIRNKYPSEYCAEFSSMNKLLEKTLKRMFIDINVFLTINKDTLIQKVNQFWIKRAKVLSELINSKSLIYKT